MSQCWETYFSSISKKFKKSYVRSSDQELTKSYYLYHLGPMFTHEARTEPYLISDSWSEVKWSEVAQSCLTLCDPMDCSLPGSSVHGILQARILEWVTISFSRGSSWPRDRTRVSRIGGRRFNLWATREARWLMVIPIKDPKLDHVWRLKPESDNTKGRILDKRG